MLAALLDGKALTAGELAQEAGITPQTASSHLSKLEGGGLVTQVKQGRHRYFRLADDDVGRMLESMMGVAERAGHLRTRQGPAAPALRKARVCYDHLAGEMGVAMLDSLLANRRIVARADTLILGPAGDRFFREFGIDLDRVKGLRRPLCRSCLDWSMRRAHLAGALGAELLDRMQALKWISRPPRSRVILFSPGGERSFRDRFPPA